MSRTILDYLENSSPWCYTICNIFTLSPGSAMGRVNWMTYLNPLLLRAGWLWVYQVRVEVWWWAYQVRGRFRNFKSWPEQCSKLVRVFVASNPPCPIYDSFFSVTENILIWKGITTMLNQHKNIPCECTSIREIYGTPLNYTIKALILHKWSTPCFASESSIPSADQLIWRNKTQELRHRC